jgi:hypothetical protein
MRPAKTALLLLLCALACHAQAARTHHPDLSGKWEMDAARSSFGTYEGPWSKAKTKVVIRDEEPNVRVIWHFEYKEMAMAQLWQGFTDGRGEMNTSLLDQEEILATLSPVREGAGPGGPKVKSETKWDGDKLLTRTDDRLKVSGKDVEVEMVDVWELSADEKSLTQTTKVTPKRGDAGGAREFRRVYTRAN